MDDGVGCLLSILFFVGLVILQEILMGNFKLLLVIIKILFLISLVWVVFYYIEKKKEEKRKKRKKRKILLIKPQKGWIYTPDELFTSEYISFTRLRHYYDCPKKFEIIYLKKIPFEGKVRNLSLIRGKLIHKILELYIQNNIDNFPECLYRDSEIDYILFFCEKAKTIIAHECDLNYIEKVSKENLLPYLINFINLNKTEVLLQRITAFDNFNNISNSKFLKTYPEFVIETEIKGYRFKGIVDRIDIYDNCLVLIDYKTMTKRRYNIYADRKRFFIDQLDFYGYLFKKSLKKSNNLQIYTEYQFLKSNEVSINGIYFREEYLWEFIENIILTENFNPKISSKCKYCIANKMCNFS